MVGVWHPYGCVVVRDHSLSGQRMAPHTPQESPKVKTRCFRVGSTRLYAPMVPLAPHPCVRWWNTKEITLKLTRLCLHSLGGSSPTGCCHPPRRRGYQRTWYSIPPTQRQWRKRDYGSLKRKPPETRGILQRILPEGHHNSTNPTSGCIVPPHNFHRSTFSFSESRTAFSFASKRKSGFGPQPGRRINSPCWAGKNQLQGKTPRSPAKEKAVSPARDTPHP